VGVGGTIAGKRRVVGSRKLSGEVNSVSSL
jgi:hypothetical protein